MKSLTRMIILVLTLLFVISCTLTSIPKSGDNQPTEVETATQPARVIESDSIDIPNEPTETPGQVLKTELNQDGPFVLFSGDSGLWLSNPDGSMLTKLTDFSVGMADLYSLISPSGDRVVFVAQDENGLILVEVLLPSGKSRILSRLLDIKQDDLINDPTGKKALAYYAISNYPSVAWMPGNDDIIAFTGAIDGETSDLYEYDFMNDEITRLTDGKAQAISPSWSPDGRFVLHYGVSWVPPFGGAIVGYNRLDGIWAVDVTRNKVIKQPIPQDMNFITLGWKDAQHYYSYDSADICGKQNLRLVDVETGKFEKVMQESFYVISAFPTSGNLLFSASADCKDSPGQGIYLFSPDDGSYQKLAEEKAYELTWLPESRVFFAYPVGLFDENGKYYDPPIRDKSYHPTISTKGYQAWEVIENRQGRVMITTDNLNWIDLQTGLIDDLLWDPLNGDTLFIVLNDGTFYTAMYPEFSLIPAGNIPGGVRQMVWLP